MILVWFILLERLNTKDRLCRFGCIPASDLLCVFCSSNGESIKHFFFECPVAWMFWHSCLQWWGISWCYHNSPMLFFEAWQGAPFRGFEKKLWMSMMYAILWSIWRTRNRIIFEQFNPNWAFEIDQIKLRVGYWVRAWCEEFPFTLEFVAKNLIQARQWSVSARRKLS